MFRWGVLSTAKIAREQMLPALIDSDNGCVTAIASLNAARAEETARRFSIPHVFNSYEALLASDHVDGVYIPIRTADHTEWTLKAAAAGKHVLCEKPIALKAADIERIIAAREETGLLISEAFMVFYHPQWHKVRELIADGAIGRLRHVQGAFSYNNMDPSSTRNRVDSGGGALLDIGVYPVVSTRIVTGREPLRVEGNVIRDTNFGTDAYSSVKADFGDFELSFYCSTQMALRQLMVFHGEKGFIEVHTPFNAGIYGDDRVTLHNETHTEAQIFRFPAVHQYKLEAEAFVRAATGAPEPIFDLENSLANQKVIDAIFKSEHLSGWVDV